VPLTEIEVSSLGGNTLLFADSSVVEQINNLCLIQLRIVNDSIGIFDHDQLISKCAAITMQPNYAITEIILFSKKVSPEERRYNGKIEVKVMNGLLSLVNVINIEQYIPGVLEAEVGIRRTSEFYKVQAIICRTYVLSHLRRHELENINLCDKEHCQVYRGLSTKNSQIIAAVDITKNIVLVDQEVTLITAAFHANCGGQTANSEDVWNKYLPYLRTIKDTFCIKQKSAIWTKEISQKTWNAGIAKLCLDYHLNTDSTNNLGKSFSQTDRKKIYEIGGCKILLKDMRTTFALRSTYFDLKPKGDVVLLTGRGFGHGVGLCQDGAIQMAKRGYDYKKILHFYYRDVNIINLHQLEFFKE
jgi:stage II sporulation protein D